MGAGQNVQDCAVFFFLMIQTRVILGNRNLIHSASIVLASAKFKPTRLRGYKYERFLIWTRQHNVRSFGIGCLQQSDEPTDSFWIPLVLNAQSIAKEHLRAVLL